MDEQTTPVVPVPVEPTPSVEPTSPAPKRGINKGLALILFILILGAAATGAYWLKDRMAQTSNVNPTPSPTPATTPNPPSSSEPLVSGLIEWHYPTLVGFDDLINKGGENNPSGKFYSVGTFKSGKYQGKPLAVGMVACECMGGPGALRLVAGFGDSQPYIILKNYSDPLDNYTGLINQSKFIVDADTRIPDLDPPVTISGPKPNQSLTIGGPVFLQSAYNLFNGTSLKFVYNDSKVGAVYTTPDDPEQVDYIYRNNGFYVKAPDWSTWIYLLKPNFIDEKLIPDVTWSDGSKNTKQYVYTDVTGCGGSNYASVVRDINIQNDLVLSGMTGKGEVVYEFKDQNHKFLKDVYDNKYNPYNQPKVSYAEFLKNHPVFFWVDPFNRLIKFENNAFAPQAECAKPVIYLYPTKTSEVSVKVAPTGGFTYTDPDYGTGWNVIAYPSGKIVANGQEYPYLFWEGRGGLYQTPDTGFVVARADVHNFLVEKLAKLGLNQKETADFIEYWEPYMQGSPYYFVTFMGNQVMDRIAPLQVDPKPDTVIRVLMDFNPLEKPIEVQGFDIKTPVRSGFTVVEWGGVKH